jgi:hypothetical protein
MTFSQRRLRLSHPTSSTVIEMRDARAAPDQ